MKKNVVLAICLSLTVFMGCKKMTDKDKTFAVMTGLDEALKRYRFDCGQFPTTEVGLKGLVDNRAGCANWKGPYIEWGIDITKDAWGKPFVYRLVEAEKAVVISFGADGKPGGSDQDADLALEVTKRQKGMM